MKVLLSLETTLLILVGGLPLTDRHWMMQRWRYRIYAACAGAVLVAGVAAWLAAAATLGAIDGWTVANTVSGALTAALYLLIGSFRGQRAFVGFSLITISVTLGFFVDSRFVAPETAGRGIGVVVAASLFLLGLATVVVRKGPIRSAGSGGSEV